MNSFNEFLKRKDPDLYLEISIGSGLNAGVGATLGAQATNSMVGNLFAPPAPNPMAPKPAANTTPAPQNTGAIIGALSGTAGALATTQKSLADAKTALDIGASSGRTAATTLSRSDSSPAWIPAG